MVKVPSITIFSTLYKPLTTLAWKYNKYMCSVGYTMMHNVQCTCLDMAKYKEKEECRLKVQYNIKFLEAMTLKMVLVL